MLYRDLLAEELVFRRQDFIDFASGQAVEVESHLAILHSLAKDTESKTRLEAAASPGCLPATEFYEAGTFCIGFEEEWNNHEESRKWADSILARRITFAADGSQMYVQKETTLPVGAVQVGWFENPHDPERRYEKKATFELLSPKILLENQEEPFNPETRVAERRFHAEVERAEVLLRKQKGWKDRGERMPLGFFDGTLLVSFSLPRTTLQDGFISAMVGLVELSEECGVPLVGYVDRSFAKDLVSMVDYLNSSLADNNLYDATLLSNETSKHAKMLLRWGDRTAFCFAKRKGLEQFGGGTTGKPLVGFTYLQTSAGSGPARIDLPAWVYEKGLLDEVMDVVRAECVIGLGYPYPLETADATALISNRDRDLFTAALREFAEREGLDFSVSRKNASKARRR